jgi:hypothetical protein
MRELTNFLINKINNDPDSVEWLIICRNYRLSDEFIRKFQDRVNWMYISIYQKLSEDFMREFKDKIQWLFIFEFQKLSEEFLVEFIDNVSLYWLERNKNVPKDVFGRIKLLKSIMQ